MNNEQTKATKIWRKPELKSYGSVEEITLIPSLLGSSDDNL